MEFKATEPRILEFGWHRRSIFITNYDKKYLNEMTKFFIPNFGGQSSKSMPILAHNEIIFFKKQVIMLYEIYFIKHYYFSIINSIIILRLKLFKLAHGSSI